MPNQSDTFFVRMPLWAAVMAIPAVAVACNDDNDITDPDPDDPATIAELVSDDENFATLEAALEAADLLDALDDEDATFTVFAPDDDGFEPINVDALLDDPDALVEVLGYHVIPDAAVGSDELEDGDTFETLSGDNVTVELDDDGSVRIEGSTVTTADVEATNGVIHVLDRTLLGNQDLADVTRFVSATGTLHQLLEEAGLDGPLGTADSVTVFGPDNEAIDDAEDLVEDLSEEELLEVLQYHVFPEGLVTSRELLTILDQEEGETELEMLQGDALTLTLQNEADVALNEDQAELRSGLLDFHGSNGVLHVIDGVLLPPGLEDGNDNEDG